MNRISLDFVDFWPGFNKRDNYFFNLLKDGWEIEISPNPHFVFYSVFGEEHKRYKCKKIFYTGENIAPIFKDTDPFGADWAFSFDYSQDPRNYRLPHYLLYPEYKALTKERRVDPSLLNRQFCSFVVSNPGCRSRNEFFEKLSRYKKIHSGGRFLNNIGYLVPDKLKFLGDYKFNICFENDAHRGYNEHYTTEKLPQALASQTIPIYFGNTQVEREFNPESFIDVGKFQNFSSAIEYIIEVDRNDELYLDILGKSPLIDSKIPTPYQEDSVKEFLNKILQNEC